MRGIVTAFILQALLVSIAWLGYWADRIAFYGAQGRTPEAAFVLGLVAIAGFVWLLTRMAANGHRAKVEARLMELRLEPPTLEQMARFETWQNYYGLTYPRTRRVR